MSSNTRCSGLSRQRGYSTSRMASAFSGSKPYLKCVGCFEELSDVIHKNEVWANDTFEQTHMGKKYLFTIVIPDYRPSVKNVELTSPVQHNASPDKNSKINVTVSFLDVTGIKPGPDLSPNQNALRITSGTEPTLIRKEDTTSLISCPVFVLSAPL
ncbi:uncharacterized protein TNCV_3421451 [Trichonephila clavipes]|nr:uncharacterized protein TNCV_3421451 [Trichonephila clavipes]